MRSRESVVVAGVDGSPASVATLLHAFTEARSRGGSVEVVTVWEDPPGLPPADEERLYRAGHRWAVQAQRATVEQARRLTRAVPPLPVCSCGVSRRRCWPELGMVRRASSWAGVPTTR